jgi:hypothetical protein
MESSLRHGRAAEDGAEVSADEIELRWTVRDEKRKRTNLRKIAALHYI